MTLRPPTSTRTYPPFPYTTLFRSQSAGTRCLRGRLRLGHGQPAGRRDVLVCWLPGLDVPDERQRFGVDRPCPGLAARALALCLQRSEEHTSELQSLMRISYAVFCLKKKTNKNTQSLPKT